MKNKMIIYAAIFCLIAGIIAGAVYMAYSGSGEELYNYLTNFFDGFSADGKRFEIFKNSMSDNLKLYIIITACAFFKAGAAGALACCAYKGFASGFTTAAFVKYYGIRGLLVPLSSLFSGIIYMPVLIIFCTYSAAFSLARGKKGKNALGKFLFFSLICLTIFCIVSFFDGYVTTTFIKLLKPFVCKIQ